MKRASLVLIWSICVSLSCGSVWAAPTTAGDAELVVRGWLSVDPQPLGVPLGWETLGVETFANDQGDAVYHVVYLRPAGFVIVSADDLVEPIIAFAAEGIYDDTPESPLAALVTADLYSRIDAAREASAPSSLRFQAVSRPRQKWDDLMLMAHKPAGDVAAFGSSPICVGGPSDVRVTPLMNTRWNQENVYSSAGLKRACYNYFTPQVLLGGTVQWVEGDENNYRCGCIATAMAQLMYYHMYPTDGVGSIICDVNVVTETTGEFDVCSRPTRGGNGSGGPYSWSDMVAAPEYSTLDKARRAIGALCYDASLAIGTTYGPDGSGTTTLRADAFKRVFQYCNAVEASNGDKDIGSGLTEMINPNLDAGNPVILAITRPGGGHAAVVDGYGFDSATSPYHHLNLGWSGSDNCWYNLPQISCPQQRREYNAIPRCAYNIFKKSANGASVTGEIISGRVINNIGSPIHGARVIARRTDGGPDQSQTSNERGIYAFTGIASGQTCTISVEKSGYEFVSRNVTAGESKDFVATSGNKWSVDFIGTPTGGCNPATLAWTWMKGSNMANQPGNYGTSGTAHMHNTPGGRHKPVMWVDSNGRLWLFGGSQQDGSGVWVWYNDLWRYDPGTGSWTWMKGTRWANMSGVYGTRGVPASSNTPGARDGTMAWMDSTGRLWLFGGYGVDKTSGRDRLNDLWRYDPATGNWTWMKGSDQLDQAGAYGARGQAAATNTPGARDGGVTWTDSTGMMWLFGGYGIDGRGDWGYLNDLWRYDPATGNWTWMKGGNVVDPRGGVYGTRNVPHTSNTPGGRWSAMSWTDSADGLWLFGGLGHDGTNARGSLNDLWRYDRGSGNWVWTKGSMMVDQMGVYGTRGTEAAGNVPGSRIYGATWTGPDGALWLFGGSARDAADNSGSINDLWRYDPATANWAWMKGANTVNQPGIYGTLGTSSTANTPGPRWAPASVRSPAGQAWLFGGYGRDSTGNWGHLNDLWQLSCAP